MRLLSTAAVLLALALPAGASASHQTRQWTEEVRLSDGRIARVARTEYIGDRIPWVERARLVIRIEGAEARWESCAMPLALEAVEGRLYVVGMASFKFCEPILEVPDSGYAAWVLREGSFVRIEFEEVPRTIRPNLADDGKRVAGKHLAFDTPKTLLAPWPIPWKVERWRYPPTPRVPIPSEDVSVRVELEVLERTDFDPPKRMTQAEWRLENDFRDIPCHALTRDEVGVGSYTRWPDGWKVFTKNPKNKAWKVTTIPLCSPGFIWLMDYAAEADRVVLTKYTEAGERIYRVGFAHPVISAGFAGFIFKRSFQAADGRLTFEWWNARNDGPGWLLRRTMKVAIKEPQGLQEPAPR